MYGYKKGNESFGVMQMPGRKKPCLVIDTGSVYFKVASFNNEAAAIAFMNFVADFFEMERLKLEEVADG